jgi:formamidopyrimidine-DNA glycosylase
MPELPEVETVVRQLVHVLPGKVIGSVEVLKEKTLHGSTVQILQKQIVAVTRKQKIIVIELVDDQVVLIHLKMTGQLIYVGTSDQIVDRVVGGHPTADWVGTLPSKHTRIIFHFTDGSTLYFNDQRMFGWIKLMSKAQWNESREVMAPDVVDEDFTASYLAKKLGRSARAIKLTILDQALVGGMGNIYANDALFIAGIHPKTPSNQVKMNAVKKLYLAMKQVIEAGIQAGGASYSHFVDTEGMGGHYQDQFMVYDREGKPCQRCGAMIEKFSLGGRGTYFCPQCQRE